ncbi:hypothetical protein C4D60_Mb00t00020 [Musa balbisiana]|uniref:Uncharacterized protein n=1 Tax=Musa balbisiana TaxID=52838 RepID=A0A4S8I4L1_MUSBA|nr:hypothetical protein C4D60_Mb00t00020 [Musa balbisiana]
MKDLGLRDPFDDLFCVEGISKRKRFFDRLLKARGSNGTGDKGCSWSNDGSRAWGLSLFYQFWVRLEQKHKKQEAPT